MLVVLFLICIVLSVVFGQAGSQFARRSAEAQKKLVDARPDPIPMPNAVREEPAAAWTATALVEAIREIGRALSGVGEVAQSRT